MAAVGRGKSGSVKRVSPLKPGLRDARNWASAQIRAASYNRRSFLRFVLSIFLMIFAATVFALWIGGFMPDIRRASENGLRNNLMKMGFVVDQIDVIGEGRLREDDVRAALGVLPGDYFFGIDLKSAQDRVEGLSWVDYAVVRRLWPDRIAVQIIERQPYALWQDQGILQVVDAEGVVISDANADNFSGLRIFVGPKALDNIVSMQGLMTEYPEIDNRVAAYVRVNQRWDLVLEPNATRIKLPEQDPEFALGQLTRLQTDHALLDKNISEIDLRVDGRLTVLPASGKKA